MASRFAAMMSLATLSLFAGATGQENPCLQAAERGDCEVSLEKFFFDQVSGTCQLFQYSGCGGNSNRFETYEECAAVCLTPQEGDDTGDADDANDVYDDYHSEPEAEKEVHEEELDVEAEVEVEAKAEEVDVAQEDYDILEQDLPQEDYDVLEQDVPQEEMIPEVEPEQVEEEGELPFLEHPERLSLAAASGQNTFTMAAPEAFIELSGQVIKEFQLRLVKEISFEFRTRLARSLLLYHTVKDVDQGVNYELYILLDRGQIKVVHVFGEKSSTLLVGKGLNRDKWHKVHITVNPVRASMTATVEATDAETSLGSLQQTPGYGLTTDVDSVIFIGGVKSDRRSRVDASYTSHRFVGCLRNVVLGAGDEKESVEMISPLIATHHRDVQQTCVNKCDDPDSFRELLCLSGSRCVNQYDKTSCDCFGTMHEGKSCESRDVATVTLRGNSYVSMEVYDWMDKAHSDANRIGIMFKTRYEDGILFYAHGDLPRHNHASVSLVGGALYTEINFGDGLYNLTIGEGLADNKWHSLIINHHGENIKFSLDGEERPSIVLAPEEIHHLHVDPRIYIGGVPDTESSQGFLSPVKFVGCLRQVYFNDVSVIYELARENRKCRHHGLLPAELGQCQDVQLLPITFLFPEAGINVDNEVNDAMILDLEFMVSKRLKGFGSGVIAHSEGPAMENSGSWQLKLLRSGEARFDLIPSSSANGTTSTSVTSGENMNDGSWHSIRVEYGNGKLQVTADYHHVTMAAFPGYIQLPAEVVLGTGALPAEGFHGCMRDIQLNGRMLDPRRMIGSDKSFAGVSLDNCQLVEPCERPDACEHGARCTALAGAITCDCEGTGYIGNRCHFGKFKRSCEELSLLGFNNPGVYKVDIDGNGPHPPAYVRCAFDPNSGITQTIVEHNLPPQMDVRDGKQYGDFILHLEYRDFTAAMLQSLVQSSRHCRQFLKYECHRAPLKLRRYTWFRASAGRYFVDNIGDRQSGRCPCSGAGECAGDHNYCNCDFLPEEEKWLFDEGYYTQPHSLGITDMYFLQSRALSPDATARVTLGPLECDEADTQKYVVTFKSRQSFLEVPGWRSGDLAFSFRTTNHNATLLYQPLYHHGKLQHGKPSFRVALVNDYELTIEYRMNNEQVVQTIRSSRPLSSGEWQQVWIDYNQHHIRFIINKEMKMLDRSKDDEFGSFEGSLFVAGVPEDHRSDSVGLIGCFRGLVMNDAVVDLYSYMTVNFQDILKDCAPSCEPDPCQNEAVCHEYWGSFHCECQNPLAQTGQFCENDINSDALTFKSPRAILLIQNNNGQGFYELKKLFTEDILLNLRTHVTNAVVLYAHDHFHNFVQLHIEEGARLIFTFNSWREIKEVAVEYNGLNDGRSVQVQVERFDDRTVLSVNSEVSSVQAALSLLDLYYETPWVNPQKEIVQVPRAPTVPKDFCRAYLGGVNYTSSVPGFVGCFRGLMVGETQMSLEEELGDGLRQFMGVVAGCNMLCDKGPCHNGGLCVEDFQNSRVTCDCETTSYFGMNCNEEFGVSFSGASVIEREYEESMASQVKIQLAFSADQKRDIDSCLLLLQTRSQSTRYILVGLTHDGSLVIEEDREGLIYGFKTSGTNFVDGFRHSVYYVREEDDARLLIDQKEMEVINLGPSDGTDNDSPDVAGEALVSVGGKNSEDRRFVDYGNYIGCLANVVIHLDGTEIKPLDEYMRRGGLAADKVRVTEADGIEPEMCAAFGVGELPSRPPLVVDDEVIGPEDWRFEPPLRQPYDHNIHVGESRSYQGAHVLGVVLGAILLLVIVVLIGYLIFLKKGRKNVTYDVENKSAVPQSNMSTPMSPIRSVSFKKNEDAVRLNDPEAGSELKPLSQNEERNVSLVSPQPTEDRHSDTEGIITRDSMGPELEWDDSADRDGLITGSADDLRDLLGFRPSPGDSADPDTPPPAELRNDAMNEEPIKTMVTDARPTTRKDPPGVSGGINAMDAAKLGTQRDASPMKTSANTVPDDNEEDEDTAIRNALRNTNLNPNLLVEQMEVNDRSNRFSFTFN